jgi:hypothetical protein
MHRQSAPARSQSLLSRPERIIAVYRGWEVFECTHGGPRIIDFDLTTLNDTATFNSRTEILSALTDLHGQLTDTSDEGEFLRDKLLGSIFYLRALLGEVIPFAEYVRYTLGTTVSRFPDRELNVVEGVVNELLSSFGVQLKAEYKEEFETKLTIHDPEEIKRGITDNQEFWLARLREKGIPTPDRLDLQVEFVKIDAYWSNWISGSVSKGFTLRINVHPRKKYELGRPLVLCLHEICGHAVQMTLWQDLIAQGLLNPACGLTTVHSPEAFICEGLGQTVADFLGDESDFPIEFWLSRWLQYYTLMVLHNAHLMIYEGAPMEEIFHYAQSKLPFSSHFAIEAELRDRGTSPLFRTYQLSYAAGEHMIKSLTLGYTPKQKQQFFFEIYSRPMTPKQVQDLARQISSRP